MLYRNTFAAGGQAIDTKFEEIKQEIERVKKSTKEGVEPVVKAVEKALENLPPKQVNQSIA